MDALPIYPLSRRARVLVAALALALVLLAGGAVAIYRVHYGIWPGARHPSALHYCGRTYERDGPAIQRWSLAPLHPAFEFSAPFAHSYRVFARTPAEARVGDTPTCTTTLYLRTSANRYLGYELRGSVG